MTQWAPAPLSEKEINAFLKICDVAKHGVEYEENWKALGYDCPKIQKKGFLSSLFGSKKESHEIKSKNELLREFLLDNIVCAGLDVLDISPMRVLSHMESNDLGLKDDELNRGLSRAFSYGVEHTKGVPTMSSIKYCLGQKGFSTHDGDELESVLEFIRASYTNIFLDIFENY